MIPVIFTIQTGMPSDFDINLLWWSLSLGACLGGMGTLVGASANVVAAGIASKNGVNISFARYLKFGFPIAIFSLVICSIYFVIKIGI
jgi:Na+/H+ antiporter NhaD/arsenite permease-like protein